MDPAPLTLSELRAAYAEAHRYHEHTKEMANAAEQACKKAWRAMWVAEREARAAKAPAKTGGWNR